jgi:hypothetical protein
MARRWGIAGLLVCAAMTPARAADAVKQTPFSINEPFEIPSMMLDPGSYVFKLVEREPQRNVLDVFETVQLWTSDETRLLSTLLTMPNYDQPTTDKTVFTFFERGPKQPKALRIWFAPGRNYGQEFVYPKIQAVELGKSVGRAVLSMPPELPGDLGKLAAAAPPAPVPIRKPATRPIAVAAPKTVPATVQSRARAGEPKMMAANLPKTASYLAMFAVLGVLGITAGSLLRILMLRLERG